jgi:hypothetical protein
MMFADLRLVYDVVDVEELNTSETFRKRKIGIEGVLYQIIHDFLPLMVISDVLCC